jgi:hypothetical protein
MSNPASGSTTSSAPTVASAAMATVVGERCDLTRR